jgi:hypothetical protein
MSDDQIPATPAKSPMPTYFDTLISTLLMGVAAPLVRHGTVTGAQEQQIIGGILALISILWQLVNASPNHQSPVAIILGLVAKSGQGAAWNAGVGALTADVGAKAGAYARTIVRKDGRPVVGAIAAPLAAKAAQEAVAAASKSFLYPQP